MLNMNLLKKKPNKIQILSAFGFTRSLRRKSRYQEILKLLEMIKLMEILSKNRNEEVPAEREGQRNEMLREIDFDFH